MASIPKKVSERLVAGIKKYQPILTAAKARDAGEADTSTIVKFIMADVFGYDTFEEITSEHAIRGTFCDLATKLDGVLQMLIEVKGIGFDLKDAHIKQAVDYGANKGVDWVTLTNGTVWRAYRIIFGKPIDHELVVEIDFCSINPKSEADLELLFLFTKEAWVRSALGEHHNQRQALSRFFLGAMILSEPVLDVIRKTLRKVSPDVRIENEQIREVLVEEVLKRDVMEGDKAEEAQRKIAKSQRPKPAKQEECAGDADEPKPVPSESAAQV